MRNDKDENKKERKNIMRWWYLIGSGDFGANETLVLWFKATGGRLKSPAGELPIDLFL